MNIKNKIIFAFIILIIVVFPIKLNANNNLAEEYQNEIYKAKVLEVTTKEEYNNTKVQVANIEILNRDYKGHKTTIKNTLSSTSNNIVLKKNDKISVYMQTDGEEINFYFHSYDKSFGLLLLCLVFIISIIVFGGLKGIKALISLVITVLLILLILVPLLLKGYNPIILSIGVCLVATLVTFIVTNGFTRKSLIAILGVSCGLIMGGIVAYLFSQVMHLSGISSDDAQMLQYLPGNISFDFKGLLFAGIIIGALGACMDVAMEITSSLIEIKTHQPKITNKNLIKSGFNIGKDIMGTMVNTLILAYTGGALSTILIFTGFEKDFNQIINLDSIAIEIVRAISGSMGLLCAIPCTIFVFIFIEKRLGTKQNKNQIE